MRDVLASCLDFMLGTPAGRAESLAAAPEAEAAPRDR
jgi:hypothetical protein